MAEKKDGGFDHEFLGRCGTCLNNAYLDGKPCQVRLGWPGFPVNEDDCLIRRAQADALLSHREAKP